MASSTANCWDKKTAYEYWIESTGAPISHGYYIHGYYIHGYYIEEG